MRNHGAVPKVDEELARGWKIQVTGYVTVHSVLVDAERWSG